MARIRTIKPEFFTSLTLAQVSRTARLTFVGLWTYCDDEGRGRDEPRLVKAAIWPLDDDFGAEHVEADLEELAAAGLIVRYTVEKSRYFQVRNWGEHQKIAHPTASRIPEPPQRRSEDFVSPPENFVNPPEKIVRPPDTFAPERKGKERKKERFSDDELFVLNHYRTAHPKRLRGDVPPKVLRLLRLALESYPTSDLCRAIDGNAASQFHRENGHLGLDLILRDASKIDYFLDLAQKKADETQEMTDEYGRMVPHRRDPATGDWTPVVSIA
jgi:hypothetical protein